MNSPRLIFLAGPNGAGKSAYFETHLKGYGLEFINADKLVASLGIPDDQATRAADALRHELLIGRKSFITETVFSDPVGSKLQFLRDAIMAGYNVSLIYIGLPTPEICEARVAQRVQDGGHDVPTDRLDRRFRQSLKNLAEAMMFVPDVAVYDNNSRATPFREVLRILDGETVFRADPLPDWLASHMPAGIQTTVRHDRVEEGQAEYRAKTVPPRHRGRRSPRSRMTKKATLST